MINVFFPLEVLTHTSLSFFTVLYVAIGFDFYLHIFFFTSFSPSFVGGKVSFVSGKFGSQLPVRNRKLTIRNYLQVYT